MLPFKRVVTIVDNQIIVNQILSILRGHSVYNIFGLNEHNHEESCYVEEGSCFRGVRGRSDLLNHKNCYPRAMIVLLSATHSQTHGCFKTEFQTCIFEAFVFFVCRHIVCSLLEYETV